MMFSSLCSKDSRKLIFLSFSVSTVMSMSKFSGGLFGWTLGGLPRLNFLTSPSSTLMASTSGETWVSVDLRRLREAGYRTGGGIDWARMGLEIRGVS